MLHNKSNSYNLSLLQNKDSKIEKWWQKEEKALIETEGPIPESPCLFTNSQDGRFSVQQKKESWTYHLAAWHKFGREQLLKVPSQKAKQEDLTISHLCGNGPRCANHHHLKLEPKWLNDERTHCHYCLANAFQKTGDLGVKEALDAGICNHKPMCFTL